MDYEQAVKNQAKATTAYLKASAKLQATNIILEDAKRNLELECCVCNHKTKIKDIELVDRKSEGRVSYLDNYDGDWHYHHTIYLICPKCFSSLNPPKDEGPFIQGFSKYVKAVHEWEYRGGPYRMSCHGRVLELLTPHFDREDAREAKEQKERKIKEAKKLLAEEGILGNNQ